MSIGSDKILTEIVLDIRDIKGKFNTLVGVSEKTGKSFSKSFTGAQASLAKFGLALGGLKQAFRIIAGPMSKIIALAGEQAKVNKQLETVIKSTGNAAGVTKQFMLDLADGLQFVTTYGNENIQVAENLLLTFKKISGDIMPDSVEAVLDMATAMDQGLKETSLMVGKALNDPIEGLTNLRRVGITFTEQQEDQIRVMTKANNISGAQAMILEELNSQFGGSARAAAELWIGKIKQMTNVLGDLLEAIGDHIGPALGKMADLVKSLAGKITEFLSLSMADQLRNDKEEFMRLMTVLKEGNLELDERNRIIGELQEKYSDYLENINLETASYDDLTEAIGKANWQFDQLIQYRALEELAGEKYKEMMAHRKRATDLQIDAVNNQRYAEEALALKVSDAAIHMGQVVSDSQKKSALEYLKSRDALAGTVNSYVDGMGRVSLSADEVNRMLSDYATQRNTAADQANRNAEKEIAAIDAVKERWEQYKLEMSLLDVSGKTPGDTSPIEIIAPVIIPSDDADELWLEDYLADIAMAEAETKIKADQMWNIWSTYLDGVGQRMAQLRGFYLNTMSDMVISTTVEGKSITEIWGGVRDQLIKATAKWALNEVMQAIFVEKLKTAALAEGTSTRMVIKSKDILLSVWGLLVEIAKGMWSAFGPYALIAAPLAIAGVFAMLKGAFRGFKGITGMKEGGLVDHPMFAMLAEGGESEVVSPMSVLNAAFDSRLGEVNASNRLIAAKLEDIHTAVTTPTLFAKGEDLYQSNQLVKVRLDRSKF